MGCGERTKVKLRFESMRNTTDLDLPVEVLQLHLQPGLLFVVLCIRGGLTMVLGPKFKIALIFLFFEPLESTAPLFNRLGTPDPMVVTPGRLWNSTVLDTEFPAFCQIIGISVEMLSGIFFSHCTNFVD